MAPMRIPLSFALVAALHGIVNASPAAVPAPQPYPVAEAHPEVTPFRASQYPTRTYPRRDILSKLEGDVNSVLSVLGSGIPSYVASGMPLKLSSTLRL